MWPLLLHETSATARYQRPQRLPEGHKLLLERLQTFYHGLLVLRGPILKVQDQIRADAELPLQIGTLGGQRQLNYILVAVYPVFDSQLLHF